MSAQPRLIADLHLGHQHVAQLRGFSSVQEHDAAIMALLKTVPNNAELYLLGDLSSGSAGAERHAYRLLGELITSRSAPTVRILGNHCRAHPLHRNGRKHLKADHELFDAELAFDSLRYEGQQVLLSHFPYEGDYRDRDLSQWYLRDQGKLLIHGHLHADTPIHPDRMNQVCVSYESIVALNGGTVVPTLAQLVELAQQARGTGVWTFQTNYAVAPGEYLAEWLEEHGLSIEQCAAGSGLSPQVIIEILAGIEVIGQHESQALQNATGIDALSWRRLQSAYLEDLMRLAQKNC